MNNKIKSVIVFVICLCAIITIFVLASCTKQSVDDSSAAIESTIVESTVDATEPRDPRYRFVVVSEQIERDDSGIYYKNCEVYADLETGIMYLLIQKGDHGGVTVLYNTDGTPMMFDFEKGRPIIK